MNTVAAHLVLLQLNVKHHYLLVGLRSPSKHHYLLVGLESQCEDVKDGLLQLQKKIEQHGVGGNEALAKVILAIMVGHRLKATPHTRP